MNYLVTDKESFTVLLEHTNISVINYTEFLGLKMPDKLAIDTETTGLDAKIHSLFCFQIGTGTNNYIIDLKDLEKNKVLLLLNKVKDNLLIFHNALFDLKFFYRLGIFPERVRDSYLASALYYNGDPTKRHGFKNAMLRELDLDYSKSARETITTVQLSTLENIEYCFNDVDKLLELENVLFNKLKVENMLVTYSLHCEHIKALAYIELCGLPLDINHWERKMREDKSNMIQTSKEITVYIYNTLPKFRNNQLDLFDSTNKIKINLASSHQMLKVFKAYNIDVLDKHGKESINEGVIAKSKHEFVKIWLDFQGYQQRVTTFGENILEKLNPDGRLYTEFKPILDTARIASRKGAINFLNFPSDKTTRDCFRASPGYKIIVADYAGQENFVTADLTGDKTMLKACIEDLDLHCAFARLIYPELTDLADEDIIKNHKSKRSSAKAPRFAFSFGGSAFTVVTNLNISMEEATRLENLYKELHKEVYEVGLKTLKKAIEVGYIQSVGGFRLILPNFSSFLGLKEVIDSINWTKYSLGKKIYKNLVKKENKEALDYYQYNRQEVSEYYKLYGSYLRLCMNNPCQSTAAHMTKLATVYLFREIIKNNHQWEVRIANVIHDEWCLEVKEELAEMYKPILENCMIKAGRYFIKNPLLIMKADANIGNSWYEAK